MRKLLIIITLALAMLFLYPWHAELGPGPDFAIAETAGQPGVIFYDTANFWNMEAGSLVTYKIIADTIKSGIIQGGVALDTIHPDLIGNGSSVWDLKAGSLSTKIIIADTLKGVVQGEVELDTIHPALIENGDNIWNLQAGSLATRVIVADTLKGAVEGCAPPDTLHPSLIEKNENVWDLEAGTLSTKIIIADTLKGVVEGATTTDTINPLLIENDNGRWDVKAGTLSTVHSSFQTVVGRQGDFQIVKTGFSSKPGGRGGVLTFRFDDGYRDCLNIIAPVLESYGVKAVLGVVASVPNHVTSPKDDPFMTWDEIRQLAHDYGWEIACHSYDHTHNHSDFWEAWFNIVKAKKVIEESLGVDIVTYIAPKGEIKGFDDYFVRQEYWCAMTTGNDYNDFGNLDPYRITTIQDLDLNVVADSGYWAVRFFHRGDSADLAVVESLIVRAKELGIEILTPREVMEKYGLFSASPLRIIWDIEVDHSFQTLATWTDSIIDLTDPDTSKFEVWENGNLVGWTIEGSYDSVTAETLKSETIFEAQNQTIPTPTSLHLWMQTGDSVSISRYFTSPDSLPIVYLTFCAVWPSFFTQKAWLRWQLEDTTAHLYWDASDSEWTSEVVYNSYEGVGLGDVSRCIRKGFYVYDLRPHVYKFTIHYRKNEDDAPEAYFDDFSVVPSTSGNVKVKVLFSKAQWYDTEIQSELDFIFDNGVGPILTSPNGTRYRIIVNDDGTLSTELVE